MEPTSQLIGRLHVRHSDGAVKVAGLKEGDIYRIGRQGGNDLILAEKKASRFHAVMNATKAGIVLSDLQSLNGTFVNGRRILVPHDLQSGDLIAIGDTTIRVELIYGESQNPGDTPTETQAVGMQAVLVTVLVADIVGYSRLSQQLPAADVTAVLETWFSTISRIVTTRRGEVDKYLGDAVLAIWRGEGDGDGAGLAEQAVNAAVQIQQETRLINTTARWPHAKFFPWECRVSLNSGEALVGLFGTGAGRDFTVLGDAVNVAFRLNDVAKHFGAQVLLSANTARLVWNSFPLVHRGQVELEGRSGSEKVFSLEVG